MRRFFFARMTEILMADGAGKLSRLARLKTLKSGLKPKGESPVGEEDALTLDVLFDEPGAAASGPDAPTSQGTDQNTESLSAYFEALGIVPDSAKVAGATGTAPQPYTPNPLTDSKPETPKPAVKGREVDARDRWADPVREDSTYLTSFAGEMPQDTYAPPIPDPVIPTVAKQPVADSAPKQTPPLDDPDPVAPAEARQEFAETRDDILTLDDPVDALEASASDGEEPEEFGSEIDIEAFEREIALAQEMQVKRKVSSESTPPLIPDSEFDPEPESAADSDTRKPLSVTFDESRAALLKQVSAQMECSIDDVVVTAIDWYLDALFGEETANREAGIAE